MLNGCCLKTCLVRPVSPLSQTPAACLFHILFLLPPPPTPQVGCEVVEGLAKLAFKIAEGILEGAEYIAKGVLNLAQAALSVAELALRAAQVLVDAAMAVVKALARLVAWAINAALDAIRIDELSFAGKLTDKELDFDFQLQAVIFGKHFHVGFRAKIDFDHIFSSIVAAIGDDIKSFFGGGGSHSDGREVRGAPSLFTLATKAGRDVRVTTDGRLVHVSACTDNMANCTCALADPADCVINLSHKNIFPEPRLNKFSPIDEVSTDYVTVPPSPLAAGVMDLVCNNTIRAIANVSHTAATIDLSRLPGVCRLSANSSSATSQADSIMMGNCLDLHLTHCILPALNKVGERKASYHYALADAEVLAHHRQFMAEDLRRCHSAICDEVVREMAMAPWTFMLFASENNALGELPDLGAHLSTNATEHMSFFLDFSKNNYNGSIPASYADMRISSAVFSDNDLTGGLEHLNHHVNLEFLDLSYNPDFQLPANTTCIPGLFHRQTNLTAYRLQGIDSVVSTYLEQFYNPSPERCKSGSSGVALVPLQASVLLEPNELQVGLCSDCDASLGPYGCVSHPCVNTTLLHKLENHVAIAFLHALGDGSGIRKDFPTPSLGVQLLNIDSFSNTTHYATFKTTYRFPLTAAVDLVHLLRQDDRFAAASTNCLYAGVTGLDCNFHCALGYHETSPSNVGKPEDLELYRMPRCEMPVPQPGTKCTVDVITPVADVYRKCWDTGDNSALHRINCWTILTKYIENLTNDKDPQCHWIVEEKYRDIVPHCAKPILFELVKAYCPEPVQTVRVDYKHLCSLRRCEEKFGNAIPVYWYKIHKFHDRMVWCQRYQTLGPMNVPCNTDIVLQHSAEEPPAVTCGSFVDPIGCSRTRISESGISTCGYRDTMMADCMFDHATLTCRQPECADVTGPAQCHTSRLGCVYNRQLGQCETSADTPPCTRLTSASCEMTSGACTLLLPEETGLDAGSVCVTSGSASVCQQMATSAACIARTAIAGCAWNEGLGLCHSTVICGAFPTPTACNSSVGVSCEWRPFDSDANGWCYPAADPEAAPAGCSAFVEPSSCALAGCYYDYSTGCVARPCFRYLPYDCQARGDHCQAQVSAVGRPTGCYEAGADLCSGLWDEATCLANPGCLYAMGICIPPDAPLLCQMLGTNATLCHLIPGCAFLASETDPSHGVCYNSTAAFLCEQMPPDLCLTANCTVFAGTSLCVANHTAPSCAALTPYPIECAALGCIYDEALWTCYNATEPPACEAYSFDSCPLDRCVAYGTTYMCFTPGEMFCNSLAIQFDCALFEGCAWYAPLAHCLDSRDPPPACGLHYSAATCEATAVCTWDGEANFGAGWCVPTQVAPHNVSQALACDPSLGPFHCNSLPNCVYDTEAVACRAYGCRELSVNATACALEGCSFNTTHDVCLAPGEPVPCHLHSNITCPAGRCAAQGGGCLSPAGACGSMTAPDACDAAAGCAFWYGGNLGGGWCVPGNATCGRHVDPAHCHEAMPSCAYDFSAYECRSRQCSDATNFWDCESIPGCQLLTIDGVDFCLNNGTSAPCEWHSLPESCPAHCQLWNVGSPLQLCLAGPPSCGAWANATLCTAASNCSWVAPLGVCTTGAARCSSSTLHSDSVACVNSNCTFNSIIGRCHRPGTELSCHLFAGFEHECEAKAGCTYHAGDAQCWKTNSTLPCLRRQSSVSCTSTSECRWYAPLGQCLNSQDADPPCGAHPDEHGCELSEACEHDALANFNQGFCLPLVL